MYMNDTSAPTRKTKREITQGGRHESKHDDEEHQYVEEPGSSSRRTHSVELENLAGVALSGVCVYLNNETTGQPTHYWRSYKLDYCRVRPISVALAGFQACEWDLMKVPVLLGR